MIPDSSGEVSDLYSLGYVLDAALAGKPAFDGEVNEILYKHMTADPDPGRYASNTPNVVIQFIEKLTRKEPRDRYQSAKAALFDVDQVLDFLNRGSLVPDFVIGGADQRTKLIDPALVGRDERRSHYDCYYSAVFGYYVKDSHKFGSKDPKKICMECNARCD